MGLIQKFGRETLNRTHIDLALKLCQEISMSQELHLRRGRPEIWAAAIVYAIAQINSLFDLEMGGNITSEIICDAFGTKKSTVSNKTALIRKKFDLYQGHPEYYSREV